MSGEAWQRREVDAWPAARFQIAMPMGAMWRDGYAWRGLGIYQIVGASKKGKRPTKWSLTHLGSGHAVAFLTGDVATAFPVASEVALAGDWTFDGLQGFKNQFPDASERLSEIIARYPKVISCGAGNGGNEDVAREIAASREA